ncbi:hypothetical protein DPEC_G00351770 [Dallia pectoralis]|uniref:Uncharacterized protein n=1 Tax=Dallia pectoralis TaxID=75939 RepID=A0ACC2F238_DALPE|nr:hypothetical protein DPEC_G00351770 [Dallia pectoralis]
MLVSSCPLSAASDEWKRRDVSMSDDPGQNTGKLLHSQAVEPSSKAFHRSCKTTEPNLSPPTRSSILFGLTSSPIGWVRPAHGSRHVFLSQAYDYLKRASGNSANHPWLLTADTCTPLRWPTSNHLFLCGCCSGDDACLWIRERALARQSDWHRVEPAALRPTHVSENTGATVRGTARPRGCHPSVRGANVKSTDWPL